MEECYCIFKIEGSYYCVKKYNNATGDWKQVSPLTRSKKLAEMLLKRFIYGD